MTRSTRVTLRIYGLGSKASSIKDQIPFSRIEGNVVALDSALDGTAPLNDHLVWIWGITRHKRGLLKTQVQSGAAVVVECRVPKGELRIRPNGAEFLHLTGAELVLLPK
jgi:hypothetical protein